MTYQPPQPATPPPYQYPPAYAPDRQAGRIRPWLWVLGGVLTLLVLCGGGGTLAVVALYHYGETAPGADPTRRPAGRATPGSPVSAAPYAGPTATPEPSASTVGVGRTVTVTGEDGERFEVSVRTRKPRKTPCDRYSAKPDSGRYLVVDITLRALAGRPEVSPFSFKFREPDGNELSVATGSGCNDIGEMVHGIRAGRKGTATVSFDVARRTGEIVLQWPIYDDAASWRVG